MKQRVSLITLAHNVRSEREVPEVLAAAQAAGARVLNPAQATAWGGYHGHFADPDGHVGEVAHNPRSELSPDGQVRWRGYGGPG